LETFRKKVLALSKSLDVLEVVPNNTTMNTTTQNNPALNRIVLKSFKTVRWMSEETICFTATVVLDGKVIGTASNEGHGGNTFVHYISDIAKQDAEAFAKSISPLSVAGWEFLADQGFTFDNLVDIAVERKDAADHAKKSLASIRRRAAKECWIINADMKKGEFKSFKKAIANGAPFAACASKAISMGYTVVSDLNDDALAAHFVA